MVLLKWPAGLPFYFCVSLWAHTTDSHVSRLFAKQCVFSLCVWCGEMSIVVAIKDSESNTAALSDFLNNSSRSYLTNSGMRLLHPRHSSFWLANVETTNSTHPLWYGVSGINTKSDTAHTSFHPHVCNSDWKLAGISGAAKMPSFFPGELPAVYI